MGIRQRSPRRLLLVVAPPSQVYSPKPRAGIFPISNQDLVLDIEEEYRGGLLYLFSMATVREREIGLAGELANG